MTDLSDFRIEQYDEVLDYLKVCFGFRAIYFKTFPLEKRLENWANIGYLALSCSIMGPYIYL